MGQNSNADWKLVFGHHPIYTAGSHGTTQVLLAELDPLMRSHGVQMYFAGHDHSKQLIQHRGLNYVVSGAGGYPVGADINGPRTNNYPPGSLKYYFENHGFAGLMICDSHFATLRLYAEDG